MSWIELNIEVECPHCGAIEHQSLEFNTLSGDQSGISSGEYETSCWECETTYFYSGRVSFELEAESYRNAREGHGGSNG